MRDTKGKEGIEYWLSSIFSKSPNSQIIIVGTHLDEGSKVTVDELKEKYENKIKECFYVSCVGNGEGIDELREKLIEIGDENGRKEIPKSYHQIATKITTIMVRNM